MAEHLIGAEQNHGVKVLTIENDVGLYHRVALCTEGHLSRAYDRGYLLIAVIGIAMGAVVVLCTTMHLIASFASCFAVEHVNVLGEKAFQIAFLLHAGESLMHYVGLVVFQSVPDVTCPCIEHFRMF